MRFTFQYIIEDLEESLVPEAFAGDPRKYRWRTLKGLVSWVLFAAMLGLMVWIRDLGPVAQKSSPHDVVSEMVPNAAAAAFICAGILLSVASGWRKSRWSSPPPGGAARKVPPGQRVVLFVFMVGLVVPIALIIGRPAWVWNATADQVLLANCAPWAVVLVLFSVLIVLQTRWSPRKLWFANPAWQRPRTIEMDDSGLRMSDAVSDLKYAWAYFPRAWETPTVLVLQAENQMRYLIPKRAFSGEQELEAARARVQNKVAHTKFLVQPAGFSVVPKRVLPLPSVADTLASGAAPSDRA